MKRLKGWLWVLAPQRRSGRSTGATLRPVGDNMGTTDEVKHFSQNRPLFNRHCPRHCRAEHSCHRLIS